MYIIKEAYTASSKVFLDILFTSASKISRNIKKLNSICLSC